MTQNSAKKILVIGLGGVGILATYALEFNQKTDVSTIIRSDYDKIVQEGYDINSINYGHIEHYKPSNIFKSIDEAAKTKGEFDYVVITTKNIPDVYKNDDIYYKAITPGKTTIVLIQNGIGIEKPLLEKFPQNAVLSGVSMISSTNYNGKVEQNGTDNLALGYFENPNLTQDVLKSKAEEFVSFYKNDHVNVYVDHDVKYRRWRKLIYNASFNTLGALTDLDVGRLQEFGSTNTLLKPIMSEVFKVAESDGVILEEELKDAMIHSDDGNWYTPSMMVDVRKGQPIEVDVIVGNVIKIAKENKVDIPILTVVYELLKLVQWRLKETKGLIELPEKRPVPTRDLTQ